MNAIDAAGYLTPNAAGTTPIRIYAAFNRSIRFIPHHPHSPTLNSLPYLQLGRLTESEMARSNDLYDQANSGACEHHHLSLFEAAHNNLGATKVVVWLEGSAVATSSPSHRWLRIGPKSLSSSPGARM